MKHISSSTWVIIPVYNEKKYLKTVLDKTIKITKNIIIVDDGSSDDCFTISKQYTQHVLRHTVNLGKGAALKTGCEYAFSKHNAEAVIFMDSDDQHDPKEIPHFISELDNGYDVVFGVRSFDNDMPLTKIALNRLASVCILFLFGSYIPDIPSGYKALTKKAYKKVVWDSKGYAVEMEIAAKVSRYKLSFTSITIQTIYHDFDRGMTVLDTLSMVLKLITWRLTL